MMLSNLLNRVNLNSEIRKNFLILMVGTTIAQIIPFVFSPILSRIFSTHDFGTFSQFTSITGLLGIIVTGRYEIAIVLPKKDKDALNIFVLAMMIAIFMSFISLLFILIFNNSISIIFKNPDLSIWLYFVPVSVLFIGLYQCLNYWFNRTKDFKRLSLNKITRNGGIVTSNIVVGLSKFGSGGLILGQIIGDGLAAVFFGFRFLKNNRDHKHDISLENIRKQAIIYKDFPLVNSLQALIDQVKESGIILIITSLFTSSILGMYSFGYRVISVPLGLVSYSVSQIYFQNTTTLYSNLKPISPFLFTILKKLVLISVFVFILIILFIEPLFVFVFGSNWADAGTYIKYLSPYLAMSFIVSPISMLPIILKKQKKNFVFSTIFNILLLSSMVLGGVLTRNIYITILIYSVVSSLGLLFILCWYVYIARKFDLGLDQNVDNNI